MLKVIESSENEIKYPVARRDSEYGFIVLFFLKAMELLFLLLRNPHTALEKFLLIGSIVKFVESGNP